MGVLVGLAKRRCERQLDGNGSWSEADLAVAGLIADGGVEDSGPGQGLCGKFEAEGKVCLVLKEGRLLAVEGVREGPGCLLVNGEELDAGVAGEADLGGNRAAFRLLKRVDVPGGIDEAVKRKGNVLAGMQGARWGCDEGAVSRWFHGCGMEGECKEKSDDTKGYGYAVSVARIGLWHAT